MLDERELLELLLSPGTAQYPSWLLAKQLLERYGDLHTLSAVHPNELARIPGMGIAKASRVIAGLELGRRLLGSSQPGTVLNTPTKIYELMRDITILHEEFCYLLTVDSKTRLKARMLLARGGPSSCHLEVREVFKHLLKLGDTRFILVHNHPSGDPTPSPEDLAITRRILWGARILGLELLDHIVVGAQGYASIRERYPELGEWR